MSALGKFLAGLGLNAAAGQPVVGIGALFYATNIGGYQDPNFIDGFRFNPDDGKWYSTPPSPDYGQFAWENPAENPYAYGFERGYDGLINLSITHNYFYIKNKYVIKLKYR